MSNSVAIRDVARAAGVSISTVSFVVNGKADKYRISHDTQARIFSAVSQLGYESKPIVNASTLNPALAKSPDFSTQASQIVLVLSAASPPDSIAMILATEPILATAGYHLAVIVVPSDPVAVRERVSQLLHGGTAGIVCCSSIYPVVSAMVAKVCPVIVLWQGAGKAMVGTIQGGSLEISGGSGPLAGNSLTTNSPATQRPLARPAPIEAPKPIPAVPGAISKPTVAPVPTPIVNSVSPAVATVTGGVIAAPDMVHNPTSILEDAAGTAATTVITSEEPVVFIPVADVPVVEPVPVIMEAPTPAPVTEPETMPDQPAIELEPVAMPESAPQPAPASTAPVSELGDPPPSTTEQPDNLTAFPLPPSVPEPVSDPVMVEPPVLSPEPVVIPEPVIEEVPAPTPVTEPEAAPVQPAIELEPVAMPESAPQPAPASTAPVSELVDPSPSTTEQPDNLTAFPLPPSTPEPVSDPVMVEPPVLSPEPVVIPEPVIEEVPAPTPVTEPEAALVQPAIELEPVAIPESAPQPVPASTTPVSELVDPSPSTTEQPDNLTAFPPPVSEPEPLSVNLPPIVTPPPTPDPVLMPEQTTAEQTSSSESAAVEPPFTANDESVEDASSEPMA